jgi:hypothetical protein
METDTKLNRFDLVTNVDKQIQNEFQVFLQTHLEVTDDLQDVFVEIPGIHFEFVYPHLSPNQSDLT